MVLFGVIFLAIVEAKKVLGVSRNSCDALGE